MVVAVDRWLLFGGGCLLRFDCTLNWKLLPILMLYTLGQACQTHTTSRAANSTKNAKRAAKVLKKLLVGQILQYLMTKNAFIYGF